MDRPLINIEISTPVDFAIVDNLLIGYSKNIQARTGKSTLYKINYFEVINDFLRNLFNLQNGVLFDNNVDTHKQRPHLSNLPYELTLSTLESKLTNEAAIDSDLAYAICYHFGLGLNAITSILYGEYSRLIINPDDGYCDFNGFNTRLDFFNNGIMRFVENPIGFEFNEFSPEPWINIFYEEQNHGF